MKNITLLLAFLPFFASCSSDNIVSVPVNAPVETAKIAHEVQYANQSFALTYNQDHTLDSAISENGYYFLSYENGAISNVSGRMGAQTFDVDFAYTNGTISGVWVDGVAKNVTFDVARRMYEIADTDSLAKVQYFLNSDGDVIEVQSFGSQGNFIDGRTYYYEDAQKGPLYNANRVTLQLAIACKKQALYSCSFGGYRPFKHFAGAHNGPIIVDNTFDADGYVINSNNDQDDFATFAYTNI